MVPHRQQPLPGCVCAAAQDLQALRCGNGHLGHGPLCRIQAGPQLLKLRRVMRTCNQFKCKAPHQTLPRTGRESPVLGQQARRLQRLGCLSRQAGSFKPQTQRYRAPRRALWHVIQPVQRRSGIAVIQRPAGRAELNTFARFLGITP